MENNIVNYESKYTGEQIDDAIGKVPSKLQLVEQKSNGNIVLADGNGNSKEYMAATPSGDPMHYVYVAIGAVWNESGEDKTYPTSWADYAEDEEDKVCVHKTGRWKMCDVGDLTNTEMIYAYRDYGLNIKFTNLQFITSKSRIISLNWHSDASTFINDGYESFADCNNLIEMFFYKNKNGKVSIQGNVDYMFAFCRKLKYIYGQLYFMNAVGATAFKACDDLRIIFVIKLTSSIKFANSPKLSKHCVRYMIENATDATLTITLHPDAYARAMADEGVQQALTAKPNVTLAKGV